MSALARLLEQRMREIGVLSGRDLGRKSGVKPATIGKILRGETKVPDLETLARLSWALDVPLLQLVQACGFPVDEPVNPADDEARLRAMIVATSELQDLVEPYLDLRLEDRVAVRAYIAGLRKHASPRYNAHETENQSSRKTETAR